MKYLNKEEKEILRLKRDREGLRKLIRNGNREEISKWLLAVLSKRVEEKKLSYCPSQIEMMTMPEAWPMVGDYRHVFGSYAAACSKIGLEPLLKDEVSFLKTDEKERLILQDSREKDPLKFKNSKVQKLLFGDYTFANEDYTYTYVDRKSENDFKATVTIEFERFCKEVEKAASFDSYIYVVVESTVELTFLNNGGHNYKMPWVWSRMRKIQHMFPRKVQFVFSGSRKHSEKLIPRLLVRGKELWDKDVQFIMDSGKC